MMCLAKTFSGLEQVLLDELLELGATETKIVTRGVRFEADTELLYKANYLLRTATRILVDIASNQVNNEDDLYRFASKIAWEDYFDLKKSFLVNAVVSSEKFTHSQYVALKTKDAIVDRFRRKFEKRPNINKIEPDIRIHVHLVGNTVTLALDASGESLHKRGYKIHQTEAPLNECLTAGMLALAKYDGSQILRDPMCGSGTIGLEAFMKLRGIPAGTFRKSYAFFHWNHFKPEIWNKVKSEADANVLVVTKSKIFISDKQLSTIKKAEQNIAVFNKYDPQEFVTKREDFFRGTTEENQLLIMNPPYNEKIKIEKPLDFYQKIGSHLKHHHVGSNIWLLSGYEDGVSVIGLRPDKKYSLYNGPIPVKFLNYKIFQGKRKENLQD